jgi:hypothetical protein
VARRLILAPICKACNRESRLTTGTELFPRYAKLPLGKKHFYKCDGCGGYCATIAKTKKPDGIIANEELRRAQQILKARAFDPLWQNAHHLEAYDGHNAMDMRGVKMVQNAARRRVSWWLADQLGIEREKCSIAMFDLEVCRRAWTLLKGIDYPSIRIWAKMRENHDGFSEKDAGERVA